MASIRSGVIPALLAFPIAAGLVAGQQPPAATPTLAASPAGAPLLPPDHYDSVFAQLQKLAPRGDRVASVRNLTLRRESIEFHLEDGKLYLATPVAGRTVGAVFVGHGSVTVAPPTAVEQKELKRMLGDSVLDSRISAAAVLFTDSTLDELERRLTFGAGSVGGDASGSLHDALDRLLEGRTERVLQPTYITALLNGDVNGFFYGHVKREHGEDLTFLVDPQEREQIELLRGGRRPGQKAQIVAQFKRAADPEDTTAVAAWAGDPLKLEGSRIDATIAKGLGFSATATIGVTALRAAVHWARFLLFEELHVDSIRDEAGTADTFFRAKQGEELWVRFDPPVRAGETRSIRVAYHGDLIGYRSVMEQILRQMTGHLPQRQADSLRHNVLPQALDNWFFVKESQTWFPRYAPSAPRYGDWPAAQLELTFHTPTRYRLASVGREVESHVDGDVATTRWVTERPVDQVCFNLGELEEFRITDPRLPPVIVQYNGDAHRLLRQLLPGQGDPERDVGGDVANSLSFFTRVFGPPLYQQYYATEVPFFYGQAFPGLMYLSMGTFQTVTENGSEESFRAHEMAHQWWGIGVEPAGYRDIWLSEGFAEFSGLWYMQLILGDNEKFFKQLRDRRKAIHGRRDLAPPIGLGWRVAQMEDPRDYSLVIYQKGAWILQMLRNLMIDFRTMKEDAFKATMQDFYLQYRGRRASTQDFEKIVERHVGLPMGWFFEEWVNGTSIPTYILSWRAEPDQDGQYLLHVRVRQEGVPKDFQMPVPLLISFADGAQTFARVIVRGPVTEGTLTLPQQPKELELNPLESVLAEVKTEGWQ